MESENVLVGAKTRVDSSPSSPFSSSSTLEFDIDGKPPHDNPSDMPEFEGKSTSPLPEPDIATTGHEPLSSPDNVTAGPETGLQGTKQGPPLSPSPMKSPSVQTMGNPPGYDPNRIPASIFSTKPTNPAEWSTNSNESLFSIHMGNNSFSRDYAILYGKSGELPKLDDQSNNNLPSLPQIPESKFNELPGGLPPVMEHEESGINSGELSRIKTKDESNSPKVVQRENVEIHCNKKKVVETKLPLSNNTPTFPSQPRLSNESGNSCSSFQFPVLLGDGGKPSSLKVVHEKPEKPPQSQPQVPTETTIASGMKWFSCGYSWPKCC